jgi:hypothetical protein
MPYGNTEKTEGYTVRGSAVLLAPKRPLRSKQSLDSNQCHKRVVWHPQKRWTKGENVQAASRVLMYLVWMRARACTARIDRQRHPMIEIVLISSLELDL